MMMAGQYGSGKSIESSGERNENYRFSIVDWKFALLDPRIAEFRFSSLEFSFFGLPFQVFDLAPAARSPFLLTGFTFNDIMGSIA
jgi:hypothetical protein